MRGSVLFDSAELGAINRPFGAFAIGHLALALNVFSR
jgi:hypothetical protein